MYVETMPHLLYMAITTRGGDMMINIITLPYMAWGLYLLLSHTGMAQLWVGEN